MVARVHIDNELHVVLLRCCHRLDVHLMICIFHLLLQVREGLYYNPYFPGGAIAMPRMLADGGVEYDDGTPSNSSQQAKVRQAAASTADDG
jgi:hypothetical protein